MSQTTTASTTNEKNANRYPEFLLEKYLSGETDQKKVQKALRKTFRMRAVEEQTVLAQAEDLTENLPQEKLPFVDEFTAYLSR